MRKIEEACGDTFTNTSKQDGIIVQLHKKTPKSGISCALNEENPLEINLFLAKSDATDSLKELLVRTLAHSFIQQQYEFHFRMREQTLFEDILADELVTSMVSFTVLGRKLGKANCIEALDQAIEQTVYRLSQKTARTKLVDTLYGFFQEQPAKNKNQKNDVLASREELISKLLEFLPKTDSIN